MAMRAKQQKVQEAEPQPAWVSAPWFANHFSLGRATVYQAIKAGKLKAIRFGDSPRIPFSEVERVRASGW